MLKKKKFFSRQSAILAVFCVMFPLFAHAQETRISTPTKNPPYDAALPQIYLQSGVSQTGDIQEWAQPQFATIGTGDGVTKTFTPTLAFAPVGQTSLQINVSGTNIQILDDGHGLLFGTGLTGGSVIYSTGVLSLTFQRAPASGTSITATWGQVVSLINNIGNLTVASCTGCGTGTVTSFSAGNSSPLFTTTVVTPTTTPNLTFHVSNATAGTVLGNNGILSGAPTYISNPVLGFDDASLGINGTLQLSSGLLNAHTILGSAATANNTFLLPATAIVTGHLYSGTTSGTVTTLTDSGLLASNVPTTAAAVVSLFSTCSGTQYLGADGACHNSGGGGSVTQSGGTLGYIPEWGTVPNLVNSTMDDSVTTASTVTLTSKSLSVRVPSSGSVDSPLLTVQDSFSGFPDSWNFQTVTSTTCQVISGVGLANDFCLRFNTAPKFKFQTTGEFQLLGGANLTPLSDGTLSINNGPNSFSPLSVGGAAGANAGYQYLALGANGILNVALSSVSTGQLFLGDHNWAYQGTGFNRDASSAAVMFGVTTANNTALGDGGFHVWTLPTTDAASTAPQDARDYFDVCNNGDVMIGVLNNTITPCTHLAQIGNTNFDLNNVTLSSTATLNVHNLIALCSTNCQLGSSGQLSIDGGGNLSTSGTVSGAPPATIKTATNCSSSASPAVCGSAAAGSFVIAASATSVTVNTSAVTANSQIFVQEDESLGSKLSVTCNTGILANPPAISARVATTSFTVSISVALTVNPVCFSYVIIN